MEQVMGDFPKPKKTPLDIVVDEDTRLEKYTRRKITYRTQDGDRVPAYLLIPHAAKMRPAALSLHQTIKIGKAEPVGLGTNPHRRYGEELAERGWVVIAPDYPNFGDYKIDPYSMGYVSATMKGIVNHMRAVDVLCSLAEADCNRIAAIGHSLGGHNAMYVSVFEPRIKAVVTSCGFNSFRKYYGGNLTGWSHKGYMPRIAEVYGKSPEKMPFDFTEVLGALAPRPVFINAPLKDANFEVSGVRDCVDAALPVYERIFRAADRLTAVYPDAGHDFPPDVREQAYAFLERWLGK
jgi:dienelactone hydrolase